MPENSSSEKGNNLPESPFRPGTAAWGLWLANQHHAGRRSNAQEEWGEETDWPVERTRDRTSDIVSPGYGDKNNI